MGYLLVLWGHFFADFACQTDEMEINKSKSHAWLMVHCMTYGVAIAIPMMLMYGTRGWVYGMAAGVTHWPVDLVTSRITSWLWRKELRHWFFWMIGFDQALHGTILWILFRTLIGGPYG